MSGQFSNVKFFLYIYSHTRVLYVIINSLEIQRFYSIYQETLSLNLMRWWDNMPMTHWIIQFNLIGVNSCVCMCVCVCKTAETLSYEHSNLITEIIVEYERKCREKGEWKEHERARARKREGQKTERESITNGQGTLSEKSTKKSKSEC